MWKGSGRSLFQTLILENFKFIVFLVTPIATASLFYNDSFVEKVVRNRAYVTYPPEGDKPPKNQQELDVAMQRRAEARAAAR